MALGEADERELASLDTDEEWEPSSRNPITFRQLLSVSLQILAVLWLLGAWAMDWL